MRVCDCVCLMRVCDCVCLMRVRYCVCLMRVRDCDASWQTDGETQKQELYRHIKIRTREASPHQI